MFGLLNVDKPFDVTSRDVVNHVQQLVRPHKVGHAGTLDPLATGVLVICIGQATRLNEFVQRYTKSYTGTFLLGCQSETEDTEGEVIQLPDAPVPSRVQVEAAVSQFRGEIMQRPPAFSALKVAGKRAYALARRGKQVDLKPRGVTIHQLDLVAYSYPEMTLHVQCSSGTYIRSLGRDIGELLGSAAVMSQLRRTAIGPFAVDQACSWRDLSPETITDHLLPSTMAVEGMPRVEVSEPEVEELRQGRFLAKHAPPQADLLAAVDTRGVLVALLTPVSDGELKPHRFFPRL